LIVNSVPSTAISTFFMMAPSLKRVWYLDWMAGDT
jgi:hypothetical protein